MHVSLTLLIPRTFQMRKHGFKRKEDLDSYVPYIDSNYIDTISSDSDSGNIAERYTLNNVPLITCINEIKNGSSYSDRIGNQVHLLGLHLRLGILPPRYADMLETMRGVDPQYCRILIVYNRNPCYLPD